MLPLCYMKHMSWWPVLGLLTSLWAQIGAAAKARASELAMEASKASASFSWESLLWKFVWVEVIAVVVLSAMLVQIVIRATGWDPFAQWDRDKNNMRLWMLVGLTFFLLVLWSAPHYADKYLPEPASVHGVPIHKLTWGIAGFTYPAFFIVHLMLFYMIWRYYNGRVKAATYMETHHGLERASLIAISIPVVVIGVVGIYIWSKPVHGQTPSPNQDAIEMEVVAEQFQWRVRYPGQDGQLGRHHYTLIGGENVLGIDFTDVKAQDDILPQLKEIHVPVGAMVTIHVRSKDVLHSLYLPHFRTHIYAVPGQKNKVVFVPTITTKEMRKKLGDPEFDYELACNQLCGGAHYNMRMKVIIESWDEYRAWLNKQKPAYQPAQPAKQEMALKNIQNS